MALTANGDLTISAASPTDTIQSNGELEMELRAELQKAEKEKQRLMEKIGELEIEKVRLTERIAELERRRNHELQPVTKTGDAPIKAG